MAMLDKLDRRFGRYVPGNITKIILAGQVVGFILMYSRSELASYFYLTGKLLLQGEILRIILFLFAPMSDNIIFVFFALYFFYFFGTQLENSWGSLRYLIYILIGYCATILFALVFPDIQVTNAYIYTSLFLAFAHLYPDFRLLLFFIIPVKVKWLGYLAWLGLVFSFIQGPPAVSVLILFSVSNFFIFFYGDLLLAFRLLFRGGYAGSTGSLQKRKPIHICAVCGQNEVDNPHMEIRYCSQCVPTTCYCGEHVANHQHKRVVN